MTQYRFLKFILVCEIFYLTYSFVQTLLLIHLLKQEMAEYVMAFELIYLIVANFFPVAITLETIKTYKKIE